MKSRHSVAWVFAFSFVCTVIPIIHKTAIFVLVIKYCRGYLHLGLGLQGLQTYNVYLLIANCALR